MPPIPAITLHSHVDLDADPVRLNDEAFLLVQRCRANVECGIQDRYVDTSGVCFLRVDADPKLTFNLEYYVRENDGLADYFPGRDLSDRSIAFAAGSAMRHQFSDDGIFIYESASDDDPVGELRAGSCTIAYDLHSGIDLTNYPVTAGTPTTYTDVPANAAGTEISDTAKNLLLQDLFNGESNLDDDFTIAAYDGDPAGAGTLLATNTQTTAWTAAGAVTDGFTYYANPPEAVVFDSSGSTRSVSHLRLARGANVLCDVELDSPVSIPANTTLRVPAANLSITLRYFWGPPVASGDDAGTQGLDSEHPAAYLIGYCLGGTRFSHFPEACFDLEFYEEDPSNSPAPEPVDTFRVPASSTYWTVSGLTVSPALTIAGTNDSPGGWSGVAVILRPCLLRMWAINQAGTYTVAAGNGYSSSTVPALDIDA